MYFGFRHALLHLLHTSSSLQLARLLHEPPDALISSRVTVLEWLNCLPTRLVGTNSHALLGAGRCVRKKYLAKMLLALRVATNSIEHQEITVITREPTVKLYII